MPRILPESLEEQTDKLLELNVEPVLKQNLRRWWGKSWKGAGLPLTVTSTSETIKNLAPPAELTCDAIITSGSRIVLALLSLAAVTGQRIRTELHLRQRVLLGTYVKPSVASACFGLPVSQEAASFDSNRKRPPLFLTHTLSSASH